MTNIRNCVSPDMPDVKTAVEPTNDILQKDTESILIGRDA